MLWELKKVISGGGGGRELRYGSYQASILKIVGSSSKHRTAVVSVPLTIKNYSEGGNHDILCLWGWRNIAWYLGGGDSSRRLHSSRNAQIGSGLYGKRNTRLTAPRAAGPRGSDQAAQGCKESAGNSVVGL